MKFFFFLILINQAKLQLCLTDLFPGEMVCASFDQFNKR